MIDLTTSRGRRRVCLLNVIVTLLLLESLAFIILVELSFSFLLFPLLAVMQRKIRGLIDEGCLTLLIRLTVKIFDVDVLFTFVELLLLLVSLRVAPAFIDIMLIGCGGVRVGRHTEVVEWTFYVVQDVYYLLIYFLR